MSGPEAVPGGASRARRATLACALLLAGCVSWAALRSGDWPGNLVLACVLLVPLALPLPGLWRGARRTYAWATLCVAPYLIYGLTEAVANPRVRALAALVLLASFALFVSLVAFLRVTRGPHAGAQPS